MDNGFLLSCKTAVIILTNDDRAGSELGKKFNFQTKQTKLEDREAETVGKGLASLKKGDISKSNSDPLEY